MRLTKLIYYILLALNILLIQSLIASDSTEELKEKINEHKAYFERLESKDEYVDELMSWFNKSRYLQAEMVDQLDTRIEETDLFISELDKKLDSKEELLTQNSELLENTMVAMYKTGRISGIEFLLDSKGLPDLLRRSKTLQIIVEGRHALFCQVKQDKLEIERLINRLTEYKRVLVSLKGDRDTYEAGIKATTDNRSEFIDKIKADKDKYSVVLRRLERSSEEISAISLEDFKKSTTYAKDDDLAGRKLPWPIAENVMRVIRSYGTVTDSRYGTRYHNSGIDIRARSNSPIYSVADGELIYKGWLKGYENVIIIKHSGGYYFIYGNLGETYRTAGDAVKTGDLIGRVSPNGWLEGPKLHFEIRKGKDELDPIAYLEGEIR